MDDWYFQRFCNRLTKGTEDTQADQPIGIFACPVGILGHALNHRGDHFSDRADRFERVSAAGFHELPAGIARHDLLDISAQGVKANIMLLDEISEIFGSRQPDLIPRLLEPLT